MLRAAVFSSPACTKQPVARFLPMEQEDAMGDKHKVQKKDAAHAKRDDVRKDKDKAAKSATKDDAHEIPGAAGFLSAGAEEDTYD